MFDKNALSIVAFIFVMILAGGCKSDVKGRTSPKNPQKATKPDFLTPVNEGKKGKLKSIEMIKNMRRTTPEKAAFFKKQALPILRHRQKEGHHKSWIILDKDLWEYDIIFAGKESTKPNQLKGHWVDFAPDLTYTYGYKDKTLGSGEFYFDLDKMVLLMVDDDDHIKPQEYKVILKDDLMILQGTPIYVDNNYQGRLRRIEKKPD